MSHCTRCGLPREGHAASFLLPQVVTPPVGEEWCSGSAGITIVRSEYRCPDGELSPDECWMGPTYLIMLMGHEKLLGLQYVRFPQWLGIPLECTARVDGKARDFRLKDERAGQLLYVEI